MPENSVNVKNQDIVFLSEMDMCVLKQSDDIYKTDLQYDKLFDKYIRLLYSEGRGEFNLNIIEELHRIRNILISYDEERIINIDLMVANDGIVNQKKGKYIYSWFTPNANNKDEFAYGHLMNILNVIPEEHFDISADGNIYSVAPSSDLKRITPTTFRELFKYSKKKVPDLSDLGIYFKTIGINFVYKIRDIDNKWRFSSYFKPLKTEYLLNKSGNDNLSIKELTSMIDDNKSRIQNYEGSSVKIVVDYKNMALEEYIDKFPGKCKLICANRRRVLFYINRHKYNNQYRMLCDIVVKEARDRFIRSKLSNIGKHSVPRGSRRNQKSLHIDDKIITYKSIMAEKGVCFNTAKKIFRQLENPS